MTRYGKTVAGLIAAWFVFALTAAAEGVFKNNSGRLGTAVGVAALVPIVLFSLWFAASKSFRQFALGLNPRTLTALHSWRFGGFVFIALQAYGILPGLFAFPAGYGDMFIGATALLVAYRLAEPEHRAGFILWQMLGIADLVIAVGLGTTALLLSPEGPSTAPMTVLPLSLIPTFMVPLFVILHVICIAQARAWKKSAENRGWQKLAGEVS